MAESKNDIWNNSPKNAFSFPFSSGQIGSKLWLCRELEKNIDQNTKYRIWVYGAWVSTMAFLLFSRENIPIEVIRSFDLDAKNIVLSDSLNNLWEWDTWKFKAFKEDINLLTPLQPERWSSAPPNLIINTSTEHMTQNNWWENIPSSTLVVLQSNNMQHPDHYNNVQSEEELLQKYPLSQVLFSGTMNFEYNNPNSFSRYMIIGYK